MEKDKIFFGESGLTSTSANHIANIAKEAYQEIEKSLDEFVLYTQTVSTISINDEKKIKEGVNEDFLAGFEAKLDEVAQYKSLIAWLREAIKAKETLIKEIKEKEKEEIAETLGLKYPEPPKKYEKRNGTWVSMDYILRDPMTEEDYWGTKNVKERNRYYQLETQCAVIGKFIHPEGAFSVQRAALMKTTTCPYELVGRGLEALIFKSKPSVSTEVVEKYFFALQKKYRALQAELNKMLHEMEVALEEDEREVMRERDAAMEEFRIKQEEYNLEVNKINNQVAEHKQKELTRVSRLKIIIPDSLKSIYQKVNQM